MSIRLVLLDILPGSILQSSVRYLAAASLVFAIAWMVGRGRWAHRVIQTRRPKPADYRRELLTSVRSVAIFAAITTPALLARLNGYALGDADSFDSPLGVTIGVVILILCHDAYFYWTHRAMHHPRLFRRWHRTHHRSNTPTAFAAYAFDWREAILHAMFPGLWLLLVPTPLQSIFIYSVIQITVNCVGHCGVELRPAGIAGHPLWGKLTTTVYHDLHHSGSFDRNFGLYFTWWDRLMGTENPSYMDVFRKVTAGGASLSDVGDRASSISVSVPGGCDANEQKR